MFERLRSRHLRIKTVISSTISSVDRSDPLVFNGRTGSAGINSRLKKVDSWIERTRKSSKMYVQFKMRKKKSVSLVRGQGFGKSNVFHQTGKGNNQQLMQKLLRRRQRWTKSQGKSITEADLIWGFVSSSQMPRLRGQAVLSRIPGSSKMTNKGSLYDNITTYCQTNNIQLSFIPITFFLNKQSLSPVLKSTIQQFIEFFQYIGQHTTLQNIWIIKPINMNQGRDIFLISQLGELVKKLSQGRVNLEEFDIDSKKQQIKKVQTTVYNYVVSHRSLIIQKYLQTPLLIDRRKFDIRIWVLIDHNLNIHIYHSGYLRFSSEIYETDSKSIQNPFVHLTNHSLQRYGPKYQQQQSTRSMEVLRQFLIQKGKASSYERIFQRIKQVVKITIQACIVPTKTAHRKCFQLFGFDFMLDRELNVRLIEANSNPSLTEDSSSLSKLIPKMLDDMLKLTVDPIFAGKSLNLNTSEGLNKNGWQVIGSLACS